MTEEPELKEGEEIFVLDHLKIAEDIRRLNNQQQVPFMAGVLMSQLMLLPGNLMPSFANIKSNNLALDNFEILCVLLGRNDKLRHEFIEQTAQHAEQGVFPEGEGQEGWNEKEFEICVQLLMLTLK